MSTPFISICIPTYKRTDLLKKLLDSIIVQTFKEFEVLINDNSPDDTIENFVETYRSLLQINYVRNVPAVNAAGNCIKVMRRAVAPWVKIMHDDDWFASPDALQHFADAAKHSGKDFIFSACNKVDLQTNESEPELLSDVHCKMLHESVLSLFYLNVIGHPSVVMHKRDSMIEYDPQFNWVLDIDFYMRYLKAHKSFHYINKRLVNIGKGPTQESYKYYKNGNVEIPEYFKLLSKYEKNIALKDQYVFHLVWNMVMRYKIKHNSEFKNFGYSGSLPDGTEAIIDCQKKIPRIILKQPSWSTVFMKRCYKKLSDQGL